MFPKEATLVEKALLYMVKYKEAKLHSVRTKNGGIITFYKIICNE